MKKLFAAGGIALALLLTGCATAQSANGSTDDGVQLKRQDIMREMRR